MLHGRNLSLGNKINDENNGDINDTTNVTPS